MRKIIKFIGYGIFFASCLGLDRITKYFMQLFDKNYYVNDIITLTLHYNRGISWGMFHSDSTIPFIALNCVIGLFIVIFFGYTLFRLINGYIILPELMVCAGAVSNMIDRIWYGGVADFILFSYKGWSFPVFNVADVFIVVGLFIMLVLEFLYYEH